MKSTSKKGSRKLTRKSRSRPLQKRRAAPKQPSKSTRQIGALRQELREAQEQQTATSEILRVIASSPTDIQLVLDVIAESAARVCNADDAVIRLVVGNVLCLKAHKGSIPIFTINELPISRGSVAGRTVVDNEPIHIEDLRSVRATDFPDTHLAVE